MVLLFLARLDARVSGQSRGSKSIAEDDGYARCSAHRGASAVARELKQTMRRVFGIHDFRPGQEDLIRSVLLGHDTLAVMRRAQGNRSVTSCQGCTSTASPVSSRPHLADERQDRQT